MAERTLGDVPGLDGLLPNLGNLTADYSYAEVNALGDVTAGADTLGALAPVSGGDPFSYQPGFLDPGSESGTSSPGMADPMTTSHLPSYDGGSDYSGGSTGTDTGASSSQWDAEQLDNAQTIVKVGKDVGASDRDIQTALMAAIVESGLKNVNYGDRDSLGLFQQRDAWGSAEQRTTPAEAAKMFYTGGHGGQRGLLDFADRDKMSLGEAAQAVQVSAYPDRYAEHESEAASLMGTLSGDTTSGKIGGDQYGLTQIDGKTVDNFTAAALQAAQKEWGGSGVNIMQGSHSTSVDASGNTHAGGGVIDVAPTDGDFEGLMTALRKIGFAAWIRNEPGYGQAGSGAHIHAVLIGDETLSPEAAQQVQSYLNNDNGLSGSAPDDGPREYINNRFVWGKRQSQDPTWRDKVVKAAQGWVGTPFTWGGQDFSGVDHENFLHNIYSKVGVELPKMAETIRSIAHPVDASKAKPGDLIGWKDPIEGLRFGISLGNGQLIEAGGPGRVVQVNELGADVLNTFGVPIKDLLGTKAQFDRWRANHPLPVRNNPGTVTTTTNPTTGHSMVEPHASVPAVHPHGGQVAGQGALNPDKPHTPMPGEY